MRCIGEALRADHAVFCSSRDAGTRLLRSATLLRRLRASFCLRSCARLRGAPERCAASALERARRAPRPKHAFLERQDAMRRSSARAAAAFWREPLLRSCVTCPVASCRGTPVARALSPHLRCLLSSRLACCCPQRHRARQQGARNRRRRRAHAGLLCAQDGRGLVQDRPARAGRRRVCASHEVRKPVDRTRAALSRRAWDSQRLRRAGGQRQRARQGALPAAVLRAYALRLEPEAAGAGSCAAGARG